MAKVTSASPEGREQLRLEIKRLRDKNIKVHVVHAPWDRQ
jgi:hypothetical protein